MCRLSLPRKKAKFCGETRRRRAWLISPIGTPAYRTEGQTMSCPARWPPRCAGPPPKGDIKMPFAMIGSFARTRHAPWSCPNTHKWSAPPRRSK